MMARTGKTPAQRRAAILRTAVILGSLAVALYLFTIFSRW